MRMKNSTRRKLTTAIRVAILTFFAVLVIAPIYWMVATSLKTHREIVDAHVVSYWPRLFTMENYEALFAQLNYGSFLRNSILVSVATALIVTVFSVLGGYSLARYKFVGKGSIMLFLLMTQMIPGILVMIPTYLLFTHMGLTNTHLSLLIFYVVVNAPFCAITMRSFFERIPVALEEASWVDGCTRLSGLLRIVLPVMFPGIVAVFVFAFIGAWNELIAGTIFLNTPDMWTIPVGLKSLIGKYDVRWGALMAGGVLALLPTAVMFVFVQRFVVEGLTAGGVKE
jgi:ABC-type sugar transport system, permease component